MPMGRTPGTKNQPGHRAGGRREGAGRKRKLAQSDNEPSGISHNSNDDDTPDPSDENSPLGLSSDPPPSPTVKLSSIHPDLIPFLGVPHNIPLVCFFDPNRYNPAVQIPPGIQLPQSAISILEDNSSPSSNQPTADSRDSTGAVEEDEDMEENHVSSSTQNGLPSESEAGQSSSPTGPYVFHNPNLNPDPTHRRKRRCLICMNAGRINHAFICPGRGNRAACATAREVAKHGGTLPAESSKWNSKNTHTPVFTPVPTPVFPLLPTPNLPAQGAAPINPPPIPIPPPPIQAAGTAALITALALPMQPPKPVAPLGYLSTGAVRRRRPRQCRICVSRALHGAQTGSSSLAGTSSMLSDSDEEEQQVSTLVQHSDYNLAPTPTPTLDDTAGDLKALISLPSALALILKPLLRHRTSNNAENSWNNLAVYTTSSGGEAPEHTSVLKPSPDIINAPGRLRTQSFNDDYDDDNTTTATPRALSNVKQRSVDDLRLLAISAQITEVSYSIGELQGRVFEIQELRHRSLEPKTALPGSPTAGRKSTDSTSSSSSIIDNALGQLDGRLETVKGSIEAITAAVEPLLSVVHTPTPRQSGEYDEESNLLRKYGDLVNEWEAVQAEAKGLRDELREDKWLAVFRTVSEQADGMMASLDKALMMCQDFIQQVYAKTKDGQDLRRSSAYSEKSYPNLDTFEDLLKSYEAKKKYYMPSTNKVINVLNKGIEDRITKNGECLRKHADMKTRWDALKIKIRRVDNEMEKVCKILMDIEKESAEAEMSSVISENSASFTTSPAGRSSRAPSTSSTSTLAKFAAKVSSVVGRSTPNQKQKLELPATDPHRTIGRKTSMLPFRSPQPNQDTFRGRSKLFSSTSSNVSAPATASMVDDWVDLGNGRQTVKAAKPRWNPSTRPDNNKDPPPLPPVPSGYRPPSVARHTPPRPPSSAKYGPGTKPPTTQPPPIPRRSSARPYTPVRITAHDHEDEPPSSPPSRPGSRAQSSFGINATPRARPKTPSMIPAPRHLSSNWNSAMSQTSDDALDVPFSLRGVSPSPSMAASIMMGGTPHRRRPSASHIPMPSFHLAKSRTGSPTNYSPNRPASPVSAAQSASSSAYPRSHTPDSSPRPKSRIHHQTSASTSALSPGRPGLRPVASRGPPSSFRGDTSTNTPPFRSNPSRPGSRAGAQTPGHELTQGPMYMPASTHDPLDNEVAKIVNSVPHGMRIERIDPPLRIPPRAGEEIKAQYAISNALGRRVLGFKLVVVSRPAGETRKVMCRVGGGWVDLSTYMTNRHSI
ncbi:hypothetical protein FRC04_005582 [Tulasnella sp. 424]|nr:hypothetical protein FRC04_005582 [Tulasnella sp. 424]